MTTREMLLVGLLCLGAAGGSAYLPPVCAQAVDVDVDIAPPPPRHEEVVVRPGYVWTPGYWRWEAGTRHHVWVGGAYVAARPGYRWVEHRWVEGPHGWHFEVGHWDRD